jgi:hypothetical protein
MQMKLVLVRLRVMQNLNIAALHPDSQPFSSRTIAQREDLRRKVMLLQLSSLAKVPEAHSVVQSTGPQFGAIRCDVDAAGAVRVSLELPD